MLDDVCDKPKLTVVTSGKKRTKVPTTICNITLCKKISQKFNRLDYEILIRKYKKKNGKGFLVPLFRLLCYINFQNADTRVFLVS